MDCARDFIVVLWARRLSTASPFAHSDCSHDRLGNRSDSPVRYGGDRFRRRSV